MKIKKEICETCGNVSLVEGKNISLNTTITVPLFVEGVLNEIRHKIQEMRKKAGYKTDDKILVCCDAGDLLNLTFIKKDILADVIFPVMYPGCDLYDEIYNIKIGIKLSTA